MRKGEVDSEIESGLQEEGKKNANAPACLVATATRSFGSKVNVPLLCMARFMKPFASDLEVTGFFGRTSGGRPSDGRAEINWMEVLELRASVSEGEDRRRGAKERLRGEEGWK